MIGGSGPSNPESEAYLDLIRQRRDHLRAVYFQHESRAQVIYAVAVAVSGAILGSIGGKLPLLAERAGAVTLLGLLATGLLLLIAFLLAICAVVPLSGRHFFAGRGWVDGFLTYLGFRGAGRGGGRGERRKPADGRQLGSVARERILHVDRPASVDPATEALITSELYNLWSLWYATVRKAGLVRLAMLFLALGLVSALPTYFLAKEAVAETPARQAPGVDRVEDAAPAGTGAIDSAAEQDPASDD